MKLHCEQKDLAFALNVVNRAVSQHTTLPVLSNIYLKASAKTLFLYATNLKIALTCSIDADVINEGEITVPARIFTAYVNLLNQGDIELKLDSSNQLIISSKGSVSKINTLSCEDFPAVPLLEKEYELFVDTKLLSQGIEQVAFAASDNLARPILSGILFRLDDDILKLAATDSYRLSLKNIPLDKNYKCLTEFVPPAQSVIELGRILDMSAGDKTRVVFSKNQVLFQVKNIELYSRLIEGVFPDYEKIFPQSNKTKIEVSLEQFIQAVRRVGIMVAGGNNNIILSVTNDGKMLLSTGETHLGESKVELEVKIEGENNKSFLNAQYLLDVSQVLDSTDVVIDLDTKISPALIKGVGKDDFQHIIMPLKV